MIEFYNKNNLNELNLAITGVFSVINPSQEQEVAKILTEKFKECNIKNLTMTLSSDFGGLGFMERENAAILNASLCNFA